MKKIFYLIIFLSITFELWGGVLNRILEYKDISNFIVAEHKERNNIVLTISGLCMHSSYVVKKIYIKKANEKYSVYIKSSFLKKKNESGKFEYDITIPDGIKKVVFGKEETVIWTKGDL